MVRPHGGRRTGLAACIEIADRSSPLAHNQYFSRASVRERCPVLSGGTDNRTLGGRLVPPRPVTRRRFRKRPPRDRGWVCTSPPKTQAVVMSKTHHAGSEASHTPLKRVEVLHGTGYQKVNRLCGHRHLGSGFPHSTEHNYPGRGPGKAAFHTSPPSRGFARDFSKSTTFAG